MPYVRPTKDVDIIVEAATRAEYYALCEQLRTLGFREDSSVGAPICRWVHGDQQLDVMPVDEEVLGLRGRWFRAACDSAWSCEIEPGCAIRVAAAPEIVATKIDAFADRGAGDYAFSKDMDDLVTLVDGRAELVDEIRRTSPALHAFIRDAVRTWLGDDDFLDALPGLMLGDAASQARVPLVRGRLERIAR